MKEGIKRELEKLEAARKRNLQTSTRINEGINRVVDIILEMVPEEYDEHALPRGYYIKAVPFDLGTYRFLCKDYIEYFDDEGFSYHTDVTQYLNGGVSLHYGHYMDFPSPSREARIGLIRDVSLGLFDEIKQWLQKKEKKEVRNG